MVIDQRNAGASVSPSTTTDGFPVDRWTGQVAQNSKLTMQQNAGSVTPPAGYINYVGVTSSSAYSVVSTDYFLLSQKIEGFNISDLGWGTANAKTVTLSFWVRSSLTGTFGGSLNNGPISRNYLFNYTISSANTWEQKTITIAGDTTGTWYTNNNLGVAVRFSLGCGTTYSGTANTWQAGNLFQPTGSVSVVGTNGATFYITGVQLEVGTSATGFEYRQFGQELALCQRYYFKTFQQGTAPAQNAGNTGVLQFVQAAGASSDCSVGSIRFPVTMRTTPTTTIYNPSAANAQFRNPNSVVDWSSSSVENPGESGIAFNGTTNAAGGAGNRCTFHIASTAEL
jgi:hypothetical protein